MWCFCIFVLTFKFSKFPPYNQYLSKIGQWSLTPPRYLGPEYVLNGLIPECTLSRTVRKGTRTISIDTFRAISGVTQNISIKSHFPSNLIVPRPCALRGSETLTRTSFNCVKASASGVSLKYPSTVIS